MILQILVGHWRLYVSYVFIYKTTFLDDETIYSSHGKKPILSLFCFFHNFLTSWLKGNLSHIWIFYIFVFLFCVF